jgi:drug/metabolite transporter (DMT)-like permease
LFIFISCIFELIPGLTALFLHDRALQVEFHDSLCIALMGFFLGISFIPYILALQIDSAGNSVPVFQTIPAFVFVLGLIFLGESAAPLEIIAAIIIMVSAALISANLKTRKINIKALALMLLSSLMLAIYMVTIRYFTLRYDWLAITAWTWTGAGIFSLIIVAAYRPWHFEIVRIFRNSAGKILYLLLFELISEAGALAAWHKAISIAPAAALVQAVSGLQPGFVLLFSVFAGSFFIKEFPPVHFDRLLTLKFALVVVIIACVYVLSL